AVVCIDIDIGDPLEAALPLEPLDQHPAVVEDTEAGRPIPRGVVQSRDRNERAPALSRHDRLGSIQRGPDHDGRGLVHAAKCRRVAIVQEAVTVGGPRPHQIDITGGVELEQLLGGGIAGLDDLYTASQAARFELPEECGVAVGPEGVAVAEGIAGESLAQDDPEAAAGAARESSVLMIGVHLLRAAGSIFEGAAPGGESLAHGHSPPSPSGGRLDHNARPANLLQFITRVPWRNTSTR